MTTGAPVARRTAPTAARCGWSAPLRLAKTALAPIVSGQKGASAPSGLKSSRPVPRIGPNRDLRLALTAAKTRARARDVGRAKVVTEIVTAPVRIGEHGTAAARTAQTRTAQTRTVPARTVPADPMGGVLTGVGLTEAVLAVAARTPVVPTQADPMPAVPGPM